MSDSFETHNDRLEEANRANRSIYPQVKLERFTYDIIRNGKLERTVVIDAENLEKADELILKEKDQDSMAFLSGINMNPNPIPEYQLKGYDEGSQ
jgi:hypothetical protein